MPLTFSFIFFLGKTFSWIVRIFSGNNFLFQPCQIHKGLVKTFCGIVCNNLLYTQVYLFSTGFFFEDIIILTGKWSDMSVLKIVVLKLTFTKWFVRMWSIAVAVFLVGLFMVGIIAFWYSKFKKLCTLLHWSWQNNYSKEICRSSSNCLKCLNS